MSVEPDLVGGDGLHPSALMYTAWARMLLPVVLDSFGARLRSSATASNPE
jgi:lysophospholipase L1-like esterase